MDTKRCPKCGETKPTTAFGRSRSTKDGLHGWCTACQVKHRNKDKARASHRRWRQSEKGKAWTQLWWQSEKGKAARRRHAWNDTTKARAKRNKQTEKHKEYQRARNATPEKQARLRAYFKTPQGKAARHRGNAKRRARRQINATLTATEWQHILEAANYRCHWCKKTATVLERDHVIPLSKGGEHVASNIVPSCIRCNRTKHARIMTLL